MLKIPGMIDPHVHLRDLDWSYKATFAFETAAAIAGGYWAVFDMPNTAPSTVTQEALQTKLKRIDATACCDWGLYFGASQTGNWDQYPVDGTCGLKMYNNATTGDLLLDNQAVREEHYKHWSGKIIAVHAEEETVLEILALVRKYRVWTHFCHISTADEIRYLTAAKEEGLPISIGVCPHHLYLTQDDLNTLGVFGLMKPELKTKADQAALWQAVENGVVDIIESDHAPHTVAEKQSDKPPFGVPGLETTLPLMVLAMHEGRIDEKRLIELLATNAQKIWQLSPPEGTYTLVDVDAQYPIEREYLRTAVGWSPFEGVRVFGKVREVWIRGTQVFDGGKILVDEGFGENCFGL
ncbi:MAG: amidohydrolase family protein [Chloroflexi bacterium]|nr:amidohydrolase family protein [Chloroflexota bacterium]